MKSREAREVLKATPRRWVTAREIAELVRATGTSPRWSGYFDGTSIVPYLKQLMAAGLVQRAAGSPAEYRRV